MKKHENETTYTGNIASPELRFAIDNIGNVLLPTRLRKNFNLSETAMRKTIVRAKLYLEIEEATTIKQVQRILKTLIAEGLI